MPSGDRGEVAAPHTGLRHQVAGQQRTRGAPLVADEHGRQERGADEQRPADADPAGRSATTDSPSTAAAIATVTSAAPGASSRSAPRPAVADRTAAPEPPPARRAAPIGALIANAHRHPASSSSTPPSTQPLAPPPAAAAVHQPSARRRAAVSVRVRSCTTASAAGDSSAAATPWSDPRDDQHGRRPGRAQPTDVAANPARAQRNIHPAPAHVGDPTAEDQQPGHRHRVGGHHGGQAAARHSQVGPDRGQCRRDDRHVQHHHELRHARHRDPQP